MPVINEKSLNDLIETNKWFQSGTSSQLHKLFEANDQGADLHTLTGIIWTCSDNVTRDDIYESLKALEQQELDKMINQLFTTGIYIDDDCLIDDPYICYEFA